MNLNPPPLQGIAAGCQLCYALDKRQATGIAGLELIEAIMAVFREVTAVLNVSTHTILLAHPQPAR